MDATLNSSPLFKILARDAWAGAGEIVPWAAVDRADGFVHLSAAHQVEETAARHFANRDDLVLLEILPDRLGTGTLRWEPSRGGELFPHVYGDISREAVGRTEPFSMNPGSDFPRHLLGR